VAATVNPLAMLFNAISARNQSGGVPPGGGPQSVGMGGGDPSINAGGGDYAQQVSELKGADPGMLLREIKQMKQKCAVLMVQNLERLPNVSGQLSKMVPMFDRVIKEIGQANNVNAAVRNPPIGLGAANPPQQEGQAPQPPADNLSAVR